MEPFIPEREREPGKIFRRKAGGGRKRMPERRVFEGIVFVEDGLPVEVAAQGTIRECKLDTQVLPALAQSRVVPRPLACRSGRVREMEGIVWKWQSIDGAMIKAPLAKEERVRIRQTGEKKEASVISWWTHVASRCR